MLPTRSPEVSRLTLAAGELQLPAAGDFGAPGFHEVLIAAHELPSDLEGTASLKLVLKLWDASRSGQTCSQDHPLSGCATVDWSDFESRPNVPPGGVFENSITVHLSSGLQTYFLSDSGTLDDEPNEYVPD